ncbi:MAG: hypothetical protein GY719_28995 [bacterium]|nr:hypothetical protein [bacterium]
MSSTDVSLLKPPTVATDSTRRPSGKIADANNTCVPPEAGRRDSVPLGADDEGGQGNRTECPSKILSCLPSRKAASSSGSWRSG